MTPHAHPLTRHYTEAQLRTLGRGFTIAALALLLCCGVVACEADNIGACGRACVASGKDMASYSGDGGCVCEARR